MAKRNMIQYNLVKNSISAYFAAIEIHNKPNIAYRYETVTLLMINAWELALKAYIRKHIKNRSIFIDDEHTIGFDKALDIVNIHRNGIEKNSFTAIKENLLKLEKYRNMTTHLYCDEIEPYIFMLVARAALNFVDFIKTYFKRDIMADEGLFILPLGFKLPFRPEDFLSDNVAKYAASPEAQQFIKGIVNTTQRLKDEGIEDSIVLGFNIHFENVKKATNSDILAAITSPDEADISFSKVSKVRFSADASQVLNMNDQEFRSIWKYTHADVVEWCKQNISGFRQSNIFNAAKKSIIGDISCVYDRKLDDRNAKSVSQKFYTDEGLRRIKEYYESH